MSEERKNKISLETRFGGYAFGGFVAGCLSATALNYYLNGTLLVRPTPLDTSLAAALLTFSGMYAGSLYDYRREASSRLKEAIKLKKIREKEEYARREIEANNNSKKSAKKNAKKKKRSLKEE